MARNKLLNESERRDAMAQLVETPGWALVMFPMLLERRDGLLQRLRVVRDMQECANIQGQLDALEMALAYPGTLLAKRGMAESEDTE